jgi:hypothetical protein
MATMVVSAVIEPRGENKISNINRWASERSLKSASNTVRHRTKAGLAMILAAMAMASLSVASSASASAQQMSHAKNRIANDRGLFGSAASAPTWPEDFCPGWRHAQSPADLCPDESNGG